MNSTPNYGFDKHAEVRLCGFDAVDRELHRIEQQTACALAAKADKCAFEKHLLERHKCCKPICDCDCYTKDEVDALLDNKANIQRAHEYDLELYKGYSILDVGRYFKTQEGIVHIHASIQKDDGPWEYTQDVAALPEGFRPNALIAVPGALNNPITLGVVGIRENGVIYVRANNAATEFQVSFNIFFVAASS